MRNPPPARRDWAWFFDVDGTLIELAAHPDGEGPDAQVRNTVARLHRLADGAVALISGRAIEVVDRFFPEVRFPVAGQLGLERRDASGCVTTHEFEMAKLDVAEAQLAKLVAKNPGLILERKSMSIALHYRARPTLAGHIHRTLRSVIENVVPDFAIQRGKGIVELKPAGKDKGIAVIEFMEETPFKGRIPVFIGDDRSDEYGFAVVNEMGGHSVKVGRGQTVASWRLRDVRAVMDWVGSGVSDSEVN